MTTDTNIDNGQKVIPIYDKTLTLTMDKKSYSLRSIYCTCMYICMCKQVGNSGCPLTELAANRPAVSTQTEISGLCLSQPSGKKLELSGVTIPLFTSHGEFLGLSRKTSQLSKSCDR